jgi:hypothetical protein
MVSPELLGRRSFFGELNREQLQQLRELRQPDAARHTRLLTATAETAMKRLHFTRAQLAAERA